MEENAIANLSRLLPEVAIVVIFALVLIWLIKYMGELHKEKSLEFTATLREIEQQHSKAYDRVSLTIDANTQMTREAKDATKEMRETLNQLLVQRR